VIPASDSHALTDGLRIPRFLIEGSKGAVLHTGDFRAEPWFITSLTRNPSLEPYIATHVSPPATHMGHEPVVRTLEAIYLDTACFLQQSQVPTKDHATSGLINLIRLYPPDTYFFINSWTWGYEDVFKAIARAFCSKVSPYFLTKDNGC
jgi:hypothetical protein